MKIMLWILNKIDDALVIDLLCTNNRRFGRI